MTNTRLIIMLAWSILFSLELKTLTNEQAIS